MILLNRQIMADPFRANRVWIASSTSHEGWFATKDWETLPILITSKLLSCCVWHLRHVLQGKDVAELCKADIWNWQFCRRRMWNMTSYACHIRKITSRNDPSMLTDIAISATSRKCVTLSESHLWLDFTTGPIIFYGRSPISVFSCLGSMFKVNFQNAQASLYWAPCVFCQPGCRRRENHALQPCSDILWFRLPWSIMNRLWSALDNPSDCSLVVCICNISAGSPSFSFGGSHQIANA